MTVTVARGSPLPWPVAIAFTGVGAALIVVGIAFVGPIDVPGASTGAIPLWLAVLIVVPIWVAYGVSLTRRTSERRRVLATAAVAEVLTDPPSEADPAVVGVLIGRGRVPAVAVAATTLALAAWRWIDIQELGDEVVVSIDATPPPGAVPSSTDLIVLRALDARRDPVTGDVKGPPLWGDVDAWWSAYAADARAHAIAAGLLEPRLPFVGLMLASVITATVVGLAIFWYIAAFVGTILLANGIPHLLARASGYRLSPAGAVERSRWLAFGRGLRERGGLEQAGPGAIAVWGPYLVYGVLVGAGPRAARVLTPDVGRHSELPPDVTVISI